MNVLFEYSNDNVQQNKITTLILSLKRFLPKDIVKLILLEYLLINVGDITHSVAQELLKMEEYNIFDRLVSGNAYILTHYIVHIVARNGSIKCLKWLLHNYDYGKLNKRLFREAVYGGHKYIVKYQSDIHLS